jgi:hypothetical protein
MMIAAGYEDGNDASSLRSDPAFKLAQDRLPSGRDLASQPTISRLENLPDIRSLLRMGRALVDLYCASFRQVPGQIVLDVPERAMRHLRCRSWWPAAAAVPHEGGARSSAGLTTMSTASSRSWCSMATVAS